MHQLRDDEWVFMMKRILFLVFGVFFIVVCPTLLDDETVDGTRVPDDFFQTAIQAPIFSNSATTTVSGTTVSLR